MSARKGDNDQIVRSSGSVYRDLGIELTAEDEIKIELAREITRVINAREYTQQQVARIWGTDQAKVSQITRGRLTGFSAERLFRFLMSLGINVEVQFTEPAYVERDSLIEGSFTATRQVACG